MSIGMKFAFALDGLIRSRTKGDGGREFADKCIREIGSAVDELAHEVERAGTTPEARLAASEARAFASLRRDRMGDPESEALRESFAVISAEEIERARVKREDLKRRRDQNVGVAEGLLYGITQADPEYLSHMTAACAHATLALVQQRQIETEA